VAEFRERLRVPLWWVLAGLVVALLAAAELAAAMAGAGDWLPYVLLVPPVLLGAGWLSRREVRVEAGVLHVPGARAPLSAFGPAEVLEGRALQLWLGPQADVDAWVAVSPWLTRAVRLPVVDPADDTPYWLVGTRDPVALLAALS
jgi:hypothetical protein